ncbi:PREDICTED: uncharacterized protein LOC105557114 [Vollenhovia emeryi]|uniref:uncharacterized protein LOC105557114 n=1 Tax=Vollenhovia emeryi TaxID=411798 RepID=UPI0005F4A6DE|nr:PREDICTED: uncharacterized protein LOC105557114 [Vollenhovia emeryi]
MDTTNAMQIEKLARRENYASWKFAMQAYLQSKDLWGGVEGDSEYTGDTKKMTKARAKIILSVEKQNFSHIQGTTTPKEAWTKLRDTFEDCGLSRKVGLLRTLTSSRLEDFSTAEGYVNRISDTAHRLKELNFEVKDELIAALMLAGLPDEYKPMIMGLEGSGVAITSDSVKVKILQDVKAPAEYKSKKKDDSEGHTSYSAFATLQGTIDKLEWFLDSCASAHMTGNKKWLRDAQDTNIAVMTSSGEKLTTAAKGTVTLNLSVNGAEAAIPVQEVLHVPDLTANLLSVSKIVEKGHIVTFRKEGCTIKDRTNRVKATAYLREGVYVLDTKKEKAFATTTEKEDDIWHRRLGHLNRKGMSLLKNGLAKGLEDIKINSVLVENQTGRKIKAIRTDNGKEFINKKFQEITEKYGIVHQTSVPYSPQQNGLAERANRTIVEKARAMLLDAGLSKTYWAEATSTAVYLINRSPTKAITRKTPEDVWTRRKPDLRHLRLFGSPVLAHIPKEKEVNGIQKRRSYYLWDTARIQKDID